MHSKKRYSFLLLALVFLVSSCAQIPVLPNNPTQPNSQTSIVETVPTQATTNEAYPSPQGENQEPATETETPQVATNPPQDQETNATNTPEPTQIPTQTPLPTPTQIPYPYHAQLGSPVLMENFAHPDLGCNWWGIGGQVINEEGEIAINILVEVGGEINGEAISGMSITGIAPVYGPGGYEIVLGDKPIETRQTIWLQLHDTEGNTLSDKVYINTYDDCAKNLLILNFVDLKYDNLKAIFFPIINR